MAKIILHGGSTPALPAEGKYVWWIDSTDGKMKYMDSAGNITIVADSTEEKAFTDLTDTFTSYSGQEEYAIIVNATADGLTSLKLGEAAQLDVGTASNEVAAGDHIHDDRYYTESELDGGQLDTRYYTEVELDAGQLDNRYYTETEVDDLILFSESGGIIDQDEPTDIFKPFNFNFEVFSKSQSAADPIDTSSWGVDEIGRMRVLKINSETTQGGVQVDLQMWSVVDAIYPANKTYNWLTVATTEYIGQSV